MLMNDLQHTLKDQTDEKYYETCQGYLSQLKLTISISNTTNTTINNGDSRGFIEK